MLPQIALEEVFIRKQEGLGPCIRLNKWYYIVRVHGIYREQ